MADTRRDFVINTIASTIASSDQRNSCSAHLAKDENRAISSFLDEAGVSILQVSAWSLGTSSLKYTLSNILEQPAGCEYQLTLTKLRSGPVTKADIPANIAVSTVNRDPISSMYHSLTDVYMPMFEKRLSALEPGLSEIMQQVKAGLCAAVRKSGQPVESTGRQESKDPNQAPLQNIITPMDEVQYWIHLRQDSTGAVRDAAQQVTDLYEPIKASLSELSAGKMEGGWDAVQETVTRTLEVVREVWQIKIASGGWAMSQERAAHFLHVLGAAVASYIQAELKSVDLWTTPFKTLQVSLQSASRVALACTEESKTFVKDATIGVDQSGHLWRGQPPANDFLVAFYRRLEEIALMRETHGELQKLLGIQVDEGSEDESDVFAAFKYVNALQVSEYSAPLWRTACEEYERRMRPLEQTVSQKLKELFGSVIIPSLMAAVASSKGDRNNLGASIQPLQVFQELKRYSGLLGRPVIAVTLQAEKDALAKQVDKHLNNLQDEFDDHRESVTRSNQKGGDGAVGAINGRNTCGIAERIMWCQQCLSKLSKTIEVLSSALGRASAADDGGSGTALRSCIATASDLLRDIEAFKKEQFDEWQNTVKEEIGDMAAWKNSKLMTFDKDNSNVKTHFNDQLVVMLREVRQLQALGFTIHKKIMDEVVTANQFYRYGMLLKQRANYYNNLHTDLIPCQKPMLLADAQEFEKVLMNPKDSQNKEITWRNAAALDGYIRKLNDVANKLAERNRILKKWHSELGAKVTLLMNTDLVRQREKWVQGVKDMREIFTRLESEGFSGESQVVWRQHWDFQLYKALEFQYTMGLECINKTLPEVEIKMVFRTGRLQYDPPLEEQRIRHYKEFLNTFLGIPMRMKGLSNLSDQGGFFRPIVEGNAAGMARVYAAAEGLFNNLGDEIKKYQDWVAMGTLQGEDMDKFVDETLQEVADWELNFKCLKSAAKEAEKLPDSVKIDCYKVNMQAVKATVDEQMNKLRESLMNSLRRKAVNEKQQIEDFIKNGKVLFDVKATSVEDIGKAAINARELVDQLGGVAQARRRIEDKNRLLRQFAAGTGREDKFAIVDLTQVNGEWDAFTSQLQQFDGKLEQQRQELQVTLMGKVDDFKGRIAGFASRWDALKPRDGPSGDPKQQLDNMKAFSEQIEAFREERVKMVKDCEAFKVDLPEDLLQQLDEVEKDLAQTRVAWDRYADFLAERDEMANKDWLSMRDQAWKIEDFLTKWSKAVEGKGAEDPIALILLNEVGAYKKCLPYLKTCMRGAGWEDEHWLQLFNILGMKGKNKSTVTLKDFLDKSEAVVKNAPAIKALDAQAQGESVIRKALAELKMWGMARAFALSANTSTVGNRTRTTTLIKEWRDIMAEVADHQSLVASLRSSNYYHLFKDEISSWENKLGFLGEGLGLLNQIQRKWVYLEPIFARGALPQQQQRFRNVDEEFRGVMQSLESTKLVVSFAEIPGIREKLPQMAKELDVCQRALADFLEEKRSLFPRFYFIGDDDLLEILGQSKNPTVIQSHLKKLFAGIHKVKFTPDSQNINAMVSMDSETVEIAGGVAVTESIELWLGDLNGSMCTTLQGQLELVRSGRMPDEFKNASSQILCLKDAISFTERVETGLKAGTTSRVYKEIVAQLDELIISDYTGQNLLQLKKQALILDFIHYKDVLEHLEKEKCKDISDWSWSRQLRYYKNTKDSGVTVCMAEGTFNYTWEYQGNAAKLVYTPLTDKCYLTLTQGMALGYGGNPYGPAGTGKTESVKALGQAMARQVLVFNCDEEFDFKSMGRIFVGLVKCGAWGCFDEFNRLDAEVLSAVSQQIQIIQGALKERSKTMLFLEKTVDVNHNAGIFVTLNPAGKGYGGRSQLPDNLKQMFRSIAMTVPNNELIAEVLLLSEGFLSAKVLAVKLVSLFTFSRELLTPQQHYDWGLRALKTCLGIAGRELREVRKGGAKEISSEQEMEIIIRALCAIKLPTLTFEDNTRFRALLGDIFPGAAITDTVNAELTAAIKEVAAALKLDLTSQQFEKMLQLHLACEQRIGIIIVGPSGSGKSTLWEVLEKSYEKLGRKPVVYKMNPKAMARQQLLGSMNMDTREWSDGVLTAAARKVVKEPLEQRSWIICDGDVDPEWIESLNSVLDDNRLLTMPNGERIQFANNINFIFECHSLEFASPATVSRCGMLFMSDENTDTDRMIVKWLKNHTASDPAQMDGFFKGLFPPIFEWSKQHSKAVDTTMVGQLDSLLSHLHRGAASKHEFASALARGLGANMVPNVRQEFLAEISRVSSEMGLLDAGGDPMALLGDELRDMEDDPAAAAASRLVITSDVTINLLLLAPWLKNRDPIIVVGPEGSGKSTLLEYCFQRMMGVQVAMVNCSAQTNAANVIQKLVQVCGKPVTTSTGKALRPADNSRIILYLKDINLPRPDKYNTSQLVAFLHQLVSHHGYYDENLEFIHIERIQIVCSMNPASTVGRHALTTRFTARARIVHMTYPDRDQLQTVYSTMLGKALSGGSNAGNIAKAMLEVYTQTKDAFSPNEQPHYQFNPRDITEWVEGLQRYSLDGMTINEAVANEGCRIFRDRLVGPAVDTFNQLLSTVLSAQLGYRGDANSLVCSTLGATTEERLSADPTRVKMVKWAVNDFKDLVADKLKGFEREFKELHLLLFREVLDRVAHFDRVLSKPGGSLLLCGLSGVGRRSCMLLTAYALMMEFYSPKMTRQYDLKAFRNDLKEVMKRAGVEGKPVMLFIEDHQIVENAFLELINSLLSGGEVPGLFSNEELAKELMPLDHQRNNDNAYTGPPSNYAYFTHRIQRNLHIVISMDPANELFRARCESNPALFTRCSMQWLDAYGSESMKQIALAKVQSAVKLPEGADKRDKAAQEVIKVDPALFGKLADTMLTLHTLMGLDANPRQFIALANQYNRIYYVKRKQIIDQQNFLKGGLGKLAEAEGTVDKLSQGAEKQRKLLLVKQAEAEEALLSIQKSMEKAAHRRQEVEVQKKKTARDEIEVGQRRLGVEDELRDVQPMIEAARKAVGQIKSDNINEIKSLKMPPDAIRDVLEVVLTIMGQDDVSWNNMKKFLSSRSVKDEIINYDARKITPTTRTKVVHMLKVKANSFVPAVIERVSKAASPLAGWATANIKYSEVLEKVAPLERELANLVASLEESQRLIVEYEEELIKLDGEVNSLKGDFGKKTGEAEALRASCERAEGTVQSAKSLLEKLSGEKVRWVTQVKTLGEDLETLPLNTVMTAAFITYLPGYPEDMRVTHLKRWSSTLGLTDFSFGRFMSSESEMLKWKSEGLPGDDLSMQNATVILNSSQSPLVVDPSSQASDWLKTHLKTVGAAGTIEVTTLHDPRFTNTLELAVRFGKTLVVQEVDKIEPILYPILRMDLDRQGPRFVVQIGDKAIDYNDTFRLFMVTRNANPYLPPDARSLIAVTNFTVTKSGLEGQLLGLTIQKEKPELEAQKSQLLQTEETLKIQLADIEKNLLHALATSTGNLLENKELLDSLNDTKSKSMTIATSLTDSKTLQVSLDEQREVYRPIARRGSTMYFLMRELRGINHMYQFSLGIFLDLFKKALDHDTGGGNVSVRIAALSDQLLVIVFAYVARSLFNADRQTFGMHMVHHMRPDLFSGEEWNFFLGKAMADGSKAASSKPSWVRDDVASAYGNLAVNFPELVSHADLSNTQTWAPWMSGSTDGSGGLVPSQVAGKINAFQQLLLTKTFRPDRLQSAMNIFICQTLNIKSTAPPSFSLKNLIELEGNAQMPILFITTPGADPTQELGEFANSTIGREKYHEVAMGQGQAEVAMQMLRDCAKSGEWLVLKNIHLVVSWLPTLEKEMFNLAKEPSFRLFLTTEPHVKFPATLLEVSLKVTFEAPPGLKKNMQRTYEGWSPEFISQGPPLRAQLLFVLAWFHGVVQERRNYVPQGWSKFYEFSAADLRSGADIATLGTKDGRTLQWAFLWGLLENAIYGGRVDNTFDGKVLKTYLLQFFNSETTSSSKARPLPGSRIVVPTTTHKKDYVDIIQALPDTDAPSVFSLPSNIDRSAQQTNSMAVINQLKQMSIATSGAGGFDRDLWRRQLSPLLMLWDKLMKDHTDVIKPAAREVKLGNKKKELDSPLDNFVALERQQGHLLIDMIAVNLGALARVLQKSDTLTSSVKSVGLALMSEAVPGPWDKQWEGPESPNDYVRTVLLSTVAIEKWWQKCVSKSLLTSGPIDLSVLFHPGTFLNAYRQQMSRHLKISMDGLKLATSWDPRALKDAIQLGNLTIQGATFDGQRMAPLEKDAPTSRAIPPMYISWIAKDATFPYSTYMSAPLYTTSERTKVLTEVQLPVSGTEEEQTWILAGLGLFLGTS